MEDIRYIQRFENFKKSFLLLENALKITNPSIVEKGGIIQFFETTFELAWKLFKDYLNYSGFDINSPRAAIKQAFSSGLIDNGTLWLEALTDSNLTVHTYDEATADEIYIKIKDSYFDILKKQYTTFQEIICVD